MLLKCTSILTPYGFGVVWYLTKAASSQDSQLNLECITYSQIICHILRLVFGCMDDQKMWTFKSLEIVFLRFLVNNYLHL